MSDNEQQNKSLPTGLLVSGICMGSATTQDGDFTNNNIFIKVGERENEIGEKESVIETVSVFGDDMQRLMQNANALKGKKVVMAINRRPARRDLQSAFMRNSINRSTVITLVE